MTRPLLFQVGACHGGNVSDLELGTQHFAEHSEAVAAKGEAQLRWIVEVEGMGVSL